MEKNFKKCACCGQELPVSEFGKLGSSPDGLHKYCRDCANKKAKEYYHRRRNKEQSNTPIEFHKPVVLNTELQRFQPRELIGELRRRGYRGELKFTQVVTV